MTKIQELENELLDLLGKVGKENYKEIDIRRFMVSIENYAQGRVLDALVFVNQKEKSHERSYARTSDE